MKPLNILFVASEVVPFAKTGGLADVAGALPKALKALGHNIIVVMPRYYQIDKTDLIFHEAPLGIPMGAMGELWAGVYESTLPGSDVPIFFLDYERFYGRMGLYSEHGYSYSDNDNRFVFLSKGAFQLCKMIDFKPDIIHANDWHTAAMPLLKNTRYALDPQFADAKTVLTIHNLQHQGYFFKGVMDVMEVGWNHFNPLELESFDGVNILKGGIAHADAVTTVSRKYAKEIQTPEFGFGLQGHIQAHSGKLFGILNGVDYDEWSPSVDPFIAKTFDAQSLEGKAECKRALQQQFGLPEADVPLIGFVGRFAEQKGIGMIAGAMHGLLHLDAQFVMLGTGEKWAEGFFSNIAAHHGDRFRVYVGYSNTIAHQIEAGCDMFLMPSKFEPCGLNQIYSLRYGTLPIVRATGGLDDTIENYNPDTGEGTGFKFDFASNDALYHTVKWAVDTWHFHKEDFVQMQRRAMQSRFSWNDAAEAYEAIYYSMLLPQRVNAYR